MSYYTLSNAGLTTYTHSHCKKVPLVYNYCLLQIDEQEEAK